MLRRRAYLVFHLAALCAILLAGCDRGSRPGMVGSAAPDVVFHDNARTVSVSQLRGRVVLLNFWATWCAPCIEELPALEDLHRRMPQIEILAVSTDHDTEAYNSFLAKRPLPFDLVRDPEEIAARRYGTDGYPESFVIDANGVVRRHFVGPQEWTSPAILDYLQKM